MSTIKPTPRPNVYDWIQGVGSAPHAHDLHAWLRGVAPIVAAELAAVVAGWEASNGSFHVVTLDDHARGWCGDTLSAESIALLRAEIGATFALHVWW